MMSAKGWALATDTQTFFSIWHYFYQLIVDSTDLLLERPPWLESMNSKQSRNAATSLVAAGTILSGDITFCQELVIAGTVNGSVMCKEQDNSVVKILEGGTFTGEINAPRVEIAGRVDANVTGTTSVSIDSSAEVSGVIRFFKLAVSPGAVITGELVTMAEESESSLAQVTK